MIKVFGPPVKTLRFEAKHSFFKSSIGLSKNRKNIFQSMAKKHQLFLYLHYQNQNLLSHEEPVFFLLLGFTSCKAEQPLRGMELHEKSTKKITGYRKSV